ncbi:hypothetical protein [Streptomyces hirsutus]|uniref:hypothetical protein n=1 Tax=Streptomyces hirsutus TaxID=35620 RepID=UPI0036A3CCF2
MTTAVSPSIDWIRLTIGGDDFTLAPSPDIDLRLTLNRIEYDGYLDPLTVGPPPGFSLTVDLIPLRPLDGDGVFRCEAQAREVAARLGTGSPVLRQFALEAALDGEDLPYNRVEVPHLLPVLDDPPTLDEDGPEPFVRVFTAKVPSGSESVYTMRRVD